MAGGSVGRRRHGSGRTGSDRAHRPASAARGAAARCSAPRRATFRRSRSSWSRSHGAQRPRRLGRGPLPARRQGLRALVDEVLVPPLLKQDARDRRRLWKTMRAALTGRPGGQLVEAIAGDRHRAVGPRRQGCRPAGRIAARRHGPQARRRPTPPRSTGSTTRRSKPRSPRRCAAGFREIKVKIGMPVDGGDRPRASSRAGSPATTSRSMSMPTGPTTSTTPCASAARSPTSATASSRSRSSRTTAPAIAKLAQHLPIRLAAGESDYRRRATRSTCSPDRSIGLIQPDVARSGGITETWRIAELAAAFHTAYAPHVGWSGAHLRRRQPAARRGRRDHCAPSSAWSTRTRCATRLRKTPVGEAVQPGRRAAAGAARPWSRHRDRPRRARRPPDRLT